MKARKYDDRKVEIDAKAAARAVGGFVTLLVVP
jgi:hypothetical protein